MKGLCGVFALALLTVTGCAATGDDPPWRRSGLLANMPGPSNSAKLEDMGTSGSSDMPRMRQIPAPDVK